MVNSLDDLNDLTESSDTTSMYSDLPMPEIVPLPEELVKESKDHPTMLKIIEALNFYEKLVKDLKEKQKMVEFQNNKFQEELVESKQLNSQLECDKKNLEIECHHLRYSLEQQNCKRREAGLSQAKIKDELIHKEQQSKNEFKWKKQPEVGLKTPNMKLKIPRENLSESEYDKGQTNNLIDSILSVQHEIEEEMEKGFKLLELLRSKNLQKMTESDGNRYQNVQLHSSQKVKNTECVKDIEIRTLKQKFDDVSEKLLFKSSKYEQLEEENKFLKGQLLLSIKSQQTICESQVEEKAKLKQELQDLKNQNKSYMKKLAEVEQYKKQIKEQARKELTEQLKKVNLFLQIQFAARDCVDQSRESHLASIRQDKATEISHLKFEADTLKQKAQIYQQRCYTEIGLQKSLSEKLHESEKIIVKLEGENYQLRLENQQLRSSSNTFCMRTVFDSPTVQNLHSSSGLHASLLPRDMVVDPSSYTTSSDESLEDILWSI
ncbi:ankyrin repeat domain-containing protein 26 [Dipodomys merriami]|uniref:ankyrin repeat domain-containing protein 26 n=1 Tax=Dipodomys merriami TaxID=94247 RepID=UPI0038556971